MNFLYRDALADGGGGMEEVTKAVKELKTEAEKGQAAVKKQIGDVADEVKGVKEGVEEVKSSVTVVRDEQDKLKEEVKSLKAARGREGAEPKRKNFNQVLADALVEQTDELEKMARGDSGRKKNLSIQLKAVGDVTTASVSGGDAWGNIIRPGIIELPKRKVNVRDLLPVGSIGPGTEFVYMREIPGEGAPDVHTEGAVKSKLDLRLQEDSVKIQTIAGLMDVTKKAFNNIPGFVSLMQSRLPELLRRAEDRQELWGDGTGDNLKGILTAGNYTASDSTADTLVEQLIDGLSQAEDELETDVTTILLRPKYYFSFFKNKAAGSGEYDLPKNVTFVNGVMYVSGIPVYSSTAMNKDFAGAEANKFLIGDWSLGAQLLVQEDMRLEISEHDQDNFRRNKYTVRIEETVALPVYGSRFFIAGDVATPVV
ncbi:phage major capsid protein [Chitinophaga rhizosphaerae]|uniref:phage major capsid protein n=1 Tax=Chitinophaga rhizosphaerae TaxID=1864947 RepID=UPI0013E01E41|nr:phage major capsid protein [Chitinophaga rhizosphaerae]